MSISISSVLGVFYFRVILLFCKAGKGTGVALNPYRSYICLLTKSLKYFFEQFLSLFPK